MRLISALLLVTACSAEAAPPIRVDQIGYPSGSPKLAVVEVGEEGDAFIVRRITDGATVFEGTLAPPALDAASGEVLRIADFSALRESGSYELRVDGAEPSLPFTIAGDPHRGALRLAMRSYYGQRCGIAVDLAPDHPGYAYPACHSRSEFHPSSGRSGAAPARKGWHDAGDYGRYVVNGGITVATLLYAWELYPEAFRDLDLAIPESGDATPDVLDEVRWQLEWMLSMQDADGGVWHKQTSAHFPPFVMPEDDDLVSLVIGTGSAPFKGTCATANLAGVTALAARVWAPFDPAFGERSLDAARRAWTWAREHPAIPFRNPASVSTGEYGDADCSDELLWAAVELWRSTGEEEAHAYVRAHADGLERAIVSSAPPGWNEFGALAAWSYAIAEGSDAGIVSAIRSRSVQAAGAIVARMRESGYRVPMVEDDWEWGSNGGVANYALQLMMANEMRPDPAWIEAALEVVHYLFGRNPFALSFVTGAGTNAALHPHHRPSGSDANAAPWPGLLVGGPNRNRQDDALRSLPESTPPMKMFVDAEASFASNEIAINWNAALVFVLAGVVTEEPAEVRRTRAARRP